MRKLKIKILKFLVKTIGMTSTGIRMSFEYGFISGKMLDYIYKNQPSGKYGIGYLLDKIYLSHKGWKAIRKRKENLEAALARALGEVLKMKGAAALIDVASGPAQYIINVLKKINNNNIKTLCRDYDERWVKEGREKALQSGISDIVFKQGDAFNRDSFNGLFNTQDVAVSSGFYDWITDDELIKKSMKIIHDLLSRGGYFVFSNQSGHVDLGMVEEIFVDFNKNPLKMTTRSADCMNQWAKEAGFEVIQTLSDERGYYSVSLVKKPV